MFNLDVLVLLEVFFFFLKIDIEPHSFLVGEDA